MESGVWVTLDTQREMVNVCLEEVPSHQNSLLDFLMIGGGGFECDELSKWVPLCPLNLSHSSFDTHIHTPITAICGSPLNTQQLIICGINAVVMTCVHMPGQIPQMVTHGRHNCSAIYQQQLCLKPKILGGISWKTIGSTLIPFSPKTKKLERNVWGLIWS